MPVATNRWVVPKAILGLAGETPMDTSVAAVTVSVAVPDFPETGSVAVIMMGTLAAFAVASPLEPAVLLIVATAVFDELQFTDDVKSVFVLSE